MDEGGAIGDKVDGGVLGNRRQSLGTWDKQHVRWQTWDARSFTRRALKARSRRTQGGSTLSVE